MPDPGDEWLVRLEFVASTAVPRETPTAQVVTAKRRSPTVDSGGIGSWEQLRNSMEHPADAWERERIQWLREIEPERFPISDDVDLGLLNGRLAEVFDSEPNADG